MAVAARPGPSDARVPCPLCGGLIHPIAGKCKHCKADLASFHAARPAANTPLPALHPVAVRDPAASALPAYALPMPSARAPSAVLPPRPTSRGRAAEPRTAGWRSWPVLVIIVAAAAIVIAAVMMVWPASRAESSSGKRTVPPPAPERMDTQGVAPRTDDPWSSPHAAPQVTPPARPPQQQAPQPQPPDDPASAPDDSADLQDSVPGGADPLATPPPRHRIPTNGRGMVMLAMADHLCRKMVQCGSDDVMTRNMCDTVSRSTTDLPTNCPAANRCLERIDAMSCASQGDDLAQLTNLLTQFRDCADAVRC